MRRPFTAGCCSPSSLDCVSNLMPCLRWWRVTAMNSSRIRLFSRLDEARWRSRIVASSSCFAILLMPPPTRLPPRFSVTFYLRQPFALGSGFVEAMRVYVDLGEASPSPSRLQLLRGGWPDGLGILRVNRSRIGRLLRPFLVVSDCRTSTVPASTSVGVFGQPTGLWLSSAR